MKRDINNSVEDTLIRSHVSIPRIFYVRMVVISEYKAEALPAAARILMAMLMQRQ